MLQALLSYMPLWASCLLICYALTLMLVAKLPELLTPPLRVLLLQISCYLELFFLICTWQWIYALCLLAFIFDRYNHAYRRWLEAPTALRTACLWLLFSGGLGVVDALNWFNAIFHAAGRFFRHPAISVGVIVATLASACWSALTHRKKAEQPGRRSE